MNDEELRLREREVVVKERELELRRNDQRLWRNPLFLGLLAAALSLGGNAVSTAYQARNAQVLAQTKLQNDLIFAALNTNDPKIAALRLKFLIRLEFLDDSDMRLSYYTEYPERLPIGPWPRDKIGNEIGGQPTKTGPHDHP